MQDIFVDIVDDQDELVIVRPLSQVIQDGLLGQIRMIKLFIANYDKELLLCRNLLGKKGEDLYDCPLTAIVHAGETYDQALARASIDVFGIDILQEQWYELGVLSRQDGIDCFTQVYELTYNQVPNFLIPTFNDFMWDKPLDIITRFSHDNLAEKSLSICLKTFYFDCTNSFNC